MTKPIGIDLGTGNCQYAFISDDGRSVVGPIDSGECLPSVVYFNNGIPVIGQEAADLATLDPLNGIFHWKRDLGSGKLLYDNNGSPITAEDVAIMLCSYIKTQAERFHGTVIDTCTLCVPANFTDEQKQAVIDAAKKAGFSCPGFTDQEPSLSNEPTAALRCADADNVVFSDGYCLVVDIGCGTTDITLANRQGNKYEIATTNGIPKLGGKDITDALVAYCRDEFKQSTGIELNQGAHPDLDLELFNRCEAAKMRLRNTDQVQIPIQTGGQKQLITITKEQSAQLAKPLTDEIIEVVNRTITEVGVALDQVKQMIPVGGGSLYHAVDPALEAYFGRPLTDIGNRHTAVCRGAALAAWAECGEVSTSTGYKLPAQVAIVHDVTSYSYGIQALDDQSQPKFATLLQKGASIPSTFTREFVLDQEGANGADIRLLQGGTEGGDPGQAAQLGSFKLENLTPVYGRAHRVEVTCSIDKNGLLKSTAYDTEKGITATEEVSV